MPLIGTPLVSAVTPVPVWVTVTVWPATVIVPLRGLLTVLLETLKRTVPFPVPGVPAKMLVQEFVSFALQAQVLPVAVTPIVLVPADGPKGKMDGEMAKVQGPPPGFSAS